MMTDSLRDICFDSTEIVKIDVHDLKLGMYISKLDRPWGETNFLFQGFELKNQADVEAVQSQCAYVFIDVSKQTDVENSKVKDTPYTKGWLEKRIAPKKESSFEKEICHAAKVHSQVSTVVKSFMQEVSLGHGINVALAKEAVAECVNTIVKSPDAMLWLTQLKNRDEYSCQHSMNVCVFSISLGRQIDLPVVELNHLGLCGMMHDMGKMRIPLEVLNKPGRLSAEEAQIMKNHTLLGWQLLMSCNNMYGGAIDAAYTHHERLDGKGYPRGLTAEGISLYSRIVAIADVYDAVTSDRVYQKGRTHLEAINLLTKESDSHLDSILTIKFIECLGIYPPGSLVEMSNGEVAVVVETHPLHRLKPKLIFLLDENKQPQKARLVNLAEMDLDRSAQPYRIKRMVRAEEYGIDLKGFYHKFLSLNI